MIIREALLRGDGAIVKSSGKPGSLENCGTCFVLGLTSQSWSSFALQHSQVT